jgi:hypothetical protein
MLKEKRNVKKDGTGFYLGGFYIYAIIKVGNYL